MSAPEKIYLQWEIEDPVTWCVDEQDDTDIAYIRADKVAELRAALEAAHKAWCEVTYSGISFDAWLEDMKNDSDCQRQKALE